jgi:hypothetical protein
MEKKKFVVRFMFLKDYEGESDSDGLYQAAMDLKYSSVSDARHLELKIVAAIPLATDAKTPAPIEAPSVEPNPLPKAEVPAAPPSPNDIPF